MYYICTRFKTKDSEEAIKAMEDCDTDRSAISSIDEWSFWIIECKDLEHSYDIEDVIMYNDVFVSYEKFIKY